MSITISNSFLPLVDPEASLAFYRDALGFEVRLDVGSGDMRWITVGPPNQPDTAIVLHPPLANPGLTEEEGRTLMEIVAKGSYFGVNLATDDLDATFARLEASGAEIVQEPMDQQWGARDCALRDPAGNMLRIQQA
ncbi:VOC family protein [Leucobacter sp. CSA1]|uniref:VOC family protein n=1 Tax=Leucobacter chromiisoli TaxID=2796471 RepID=A0A934Q736_9MICO|nr:VOC family protein [Leucobacter chromiisoli]MBK0417772.1 VOC family protein [Leucobacter chromiisoli]